MTPIAKKLPKPRRSPHRAGRDAPGAEGPLVVAPVYDGLCTFEFAIVAEVFGLPRPEMGAGWYRFASVAIEPGPLRAQGGLRVQADGALELLAQADWVVLPGWRGLQAPLPPAFAAALRQAWQRGARLASICSGAFVLAQLGLLDGRRATTHWRYAEQLAQLHPAIEVDPDVLYIADPAARLYTSAGSAAGIDLMLHIVREDFGVAAAHRVARRLVMPPHREGGQAQFIERPLSDRRGGAMAVLMDRVRADLAHRWTVAEMAEALAMSPRHFVRRFAEATGLPPGAWVTRTRVEEARRLLEDSRLPVERVATEVGFGSAQALRHQFRTQLGLAPRAYRSSFGR